MARGLAVLPAYPPALLVISIRRVIVHFLYVLINTSASSDSERSCAVISNHGCKVKQKTQICQTNPRFLIIFYFVGTSSSVFFSNCQKGSTVSMRARSVVV